MKKILLASALTLMGGNVMSNELAPEIFVNDGSASVNSIKDAAMNYAKFWNTGDEAYAREALAMDFIDKTPPEGRRAGIEGVLEASANFRKAVPDLHVTVEHLLITGEFATIRYRFKGHFSGVMGEVKGANQTKPSTSQPLISTKFSKVKLLTTGTWKIMPLSLLKQGLSKQFLIKTCSWFGQIRDYW
ncbi:ester cyclase [Vibrio vulnificus]|nr:ester cyclase [Vibrio vulnificus]